MAKKRISFDIKLGAPTKYNPQYAEDLIDYFNIQPNREVPVITTSKNGTVTETTQLMPSDMPTFAGFAVKIGVDRHTLNEWANKKDADGDYVHPEFVMAYKMAKECQEHILVSNGLLSLYQPSFAIFTAKNVIGWRDKTETDIKFEDVSAFNDDQITRIARRIAQGGGPDGQTASEE